MVTYVNDLRLSELATGEGSGTWGTTTNTNLELIGEALGYGTEGITTNADTHATTVADGSTDAGRAMYIKYTGTLDSACTITIGPNTDCRVHFIENATSGSQSIIISQGSGANVTIPNGYVKAVYLDGAGAGAAVVEAFTDLSVGGNLLIDGATPTLTIGDAGAEDTKIVFDGNAKDFYVGLDDSADKLVIGEGSTVGTNNILTITDDTVTIGDGAAADTAIVFDGNAQDFYIGLDDSADDLIIGLGSTVGTTPIISVDENKDVAIPDGSLTITVDDNSDNLTLTSTDADSNSGPNLRLYRNSGSPADSDALGLIEFEGRNDNTQDVVYAGIDSRIVDASDGTEDGRLEIVTMLAGTAGTSRILMDATETVFNDNSKDLDFRVESDGDTHRLFIDGGNNRILFGTTAARVMSGVTTDFFIEGTAYGDSSIGAVINANGVLDSPALFFGKSRGTSLGSNTIVQNGDRLFTLRVDGSDGTNLEQAAMIEVHVDAAPGANEIPGRLTFHTTTAGSQYATEKMRIDNAGHVTMPLQSNAGVNMTLQSNVATTPTTLDFDTARFDQNDDFNTSTNTFTAPVTGKYLVCVNLYMLNVDQAAEYYQLYVATSNKTYYSIFDPGGNSGDLVYWDMSWAGVVDMDASDTCLFKINQSGGTAQTDYSDGSYASITLLT